MQLSTALLPTWTAIFTFALGIWMLARPEWFAARNKRLGKVADTGGRIRAAAVALILVGCAAVGLAIRLWLQPF